MPKFIHISPLAVAIGLAYKTISHKHGDSREMAETMANCLMLLSIQPDEVEALGQAILAVENNVDKIMQAKKEGRDISMMGVFRSIEDDDSDLPGPVDKLHWN